MMFNLSPHERGDSAGAAKKEMVEKKKNTMYGDLVNGITYSLFLPVYIYLFLIEEENDGAIYVAASFGWVAVWCWVSYWSSHWFASLMAFSGGCFSSAAMNLFEWPHQGEVVVLPQFIWFLLIASSNQNLSLAVKLLMGIIAFGTAVFVTVQSPLGDAAQTGPYLLGWIVVYSMFHYYATVTKESREGSPVVSAKIALLVLGGTFAHHTATELITMLSTSGYALTGGFSILKAGFFGAIGLAAAGAFRDEIVLNETLSRLVEERAKELYKQSARLQMIGLAMEKSETPIAIVDARHHILWANPALGLLAGTGEPQLVDQCIVHALPMTYWDRSKLTKCFENGVGEEDVQIHDRTFSAQISSYPDQVGRTEHGTPKFVVALRDITERRARERAEKLAEEESLLARALTDAMEMLSHELRTPLQGIMGMTSLLLADKDVPQDSKEPLSLIMASSRLLLTLINNMLDVRKCDANMMDNFSLSLQTVGPSLEEAVDFCRPIGSIAGVELVTSTITTENTTVKINPLRLQQMIINLVSNAIKYSPKQATVTVRTYLMSLGDVKREMDKAIATGPRQTSDDNENSTQVLCVAVSDEGAGIGEEAKTAIFQKFSQLKSKQENTIGNVSVGQPSGTGLGLNLCVKFASRMGGTMWVTNNPEKGSSFCFYLPAVSTVAPTPHLAPKPLTKQLSLSAPTKETRCKILLVDDTLINLKVLKRMLERIGVKSITTAESGEAALEELASAERQKVPFELVITDIQMPGMDGFELCRVINERATHQGSNPVVVGLTAETSESLHKRADDCGMRCIMFKPITAAEMKQFLATTLNVPML